MNSWIIHFDCSLIICCILHVTGYLKNVSSDMKTLRPTILPAVPRFLNRIYKECVTTANKTSFFRQVFNLGLQLKTDELYKGRLCTFNDVKSFSSFYYTQSTT